MKYRANLKAKGGDLKIGNDMEFAAYVEKRIVKNKYSPGAVLGEIKAKGKKFKTTISKTTLYRYIENGVFLTLSNKHLPVKGGRKKKSEKKEQKSAPKGTSIEKRPPEIAERSTFGNWEMDCVEGKKKTKETLLVLTERLTRDEIVRLMKDKTADSVTSELDALERELGSEKFALLFRSITIDNGSEFSDCEGMERSINGGTRTKVYYCHPYSAYERGSNENCNKLIRRHFPKGTSFKGVSREIIKKLEKWINNYPRGIFGYHSSGELFRQYVAEIDAILAPK